MLRPVTIEKFGGLNLADDPSELGAAGAVDLRNIWFERGGIQTAPTVSAFATATRPVTRLFTHGLDFGVQLLASENDGTDTTLEAFDLVGASIATTTYPSSSIDPHGFANIATPSASATYAVRLGESTRKWNGTAWSTVAAVPRGNCAAPADNATRLAVGFAGSNRSRVAFSNAGDPEVFGVDDYVDIAPGDGQAICDLVFWENKLFAFKNTKFAVFYGVGIDAAGEPIFNYRMVDNGVGIGARGAGYSGGACAGRDGVYFIGHDGIYRTRGDEPQLISRLISPLWPGARRRPSDTNVPGISLSSAVGLAEVNGVLYLSVPADGSGTGTYVTLALVDGQWTYLDVQSSTGAWYSNFAEMRWLTLFSTCDSTAIKQLTPGDGPSDALTWQYQSGFYDLGSPAEKKVRFTDLYGSGTPTVQLLTRGARASDVADTGGAVTLGTAPAIARARRARSARGRQFAHKLTGTGAFTVSRLDYLYLPPGSAA